MTTCSTGLSLAYFTWQNAFRTQGPACHEQQDFRLSWLNNILLVCNRIHTHTHTHTHTYHIFFIHSSIDGHLGCFAVFATVNNVSVSLGVQISFQDPVFISFGHILRNGIARSYDSSVFKFLRIFDTVFHNGCTNLHFHQLCTGFPLL